MTRVLAVYNTCGISGRDNGDAYLVSLQTLLEQELAPGDQMDVVVSACLNTPEQLQKIKDKFGDKIPIHDIRDVLTVNQTFNSTVNRCVEKFGEYDTYLYIDSGVTFVDSTTVSKMIVAHNTQEYGMITVPVDEDHGFHIFGFLYPPRPFIIPVGLACNLHVQMFHPEIRRVFGQIIPDVFASFCTESTFSFLNACIQKKWLILNNTIVHHNHSMDKASSGFGHGDWKHILPEAPRRMEEVIMDREGTECGFGYEECGHIKMHDPNAFDSEGYAKYPELLIDFIKKNIFIQPDKFDYSKIKGTFI